MTEFDAPSLAPHAWMHARGSIGLQRPRVMAIINATPDSFFDGGRLHDGHATRIDAALEHARRAVSQGADILDVGGESTRPGAAPVDPQEEQARVVPLVEALRGDRTLDTIPISIDTRRASVAAAAIRAGASIVNDISGLEDPKMAAVVAREGVGLVLGHLRGEPRTMQREICFTHVLREVTDELVSRVGMAVDAGVERSRIVVDPGVGFGKTAQQSAALVAASGWLREATGCPVLIGASRKSFLAEIMGGIMGGTTGGTTREPVAGDRLAGSLAAALVAVKRGASVLRVHDVQETVQALAVAMSIEHAFAALGGAQAAQEGRP